MVIEGHQRKLLDSFRCCFPKKKKNLLLTLFGGVVNTHEATKNEITAFFVTTLPQPTQ